jgi:hypothetical protein
MGQGMEQDGDDILIPLTLEGMRMFAGTLNAVDRRCPFCGAPKGRSCTTLRGKKRKVLHKQRFKG